MRMQQASRLCAGLFLVVMLAAAQEATKEAKIEKILSLTNADAMTNQMLNQMKAMQAAQMPAAMPPEDRAKALESMDKIMNLVRTELNWDKLKPHFVKAYAETFSDEEIDGIFAFYDSPAGRAMLEKTPILMSKTMSIVQQQMAEIMPKLQQLHREAQEPK